MIDMLKDDLEQHRPSRNESFVEEVRARLRPFVEQDWGHISVLAYDLEPDYRADDEAWLSARRQFDEARYLRRHYVAEHAGTRQVLGYGAIEQSIFRPNYRLFLLANAKWLRAGVGDLLLDRLLEDLQETNAITVWARSYVSQTDLLAFLAERGFVETNRVWDLRLILSEAEHADFLSVKAQLSTRGIVITTLADERQRDPDCLHKLLAFLNLVKADDPQRQPFSPIPFDAVVRWFEKSYVLPDACFIAKHGADYVGFADLILFEALPGGAKSGFTGVKREYRRQGVATALKLHAIAYARARGYQTIRAFTPAANPAMLALNKKLGFQRRFGYVTMEKFLRRIAIIDSNVYDAYVGQYAPAPDIVAKFGFDPGFTVAITKEGQRLFAIAKEQKNELFPESETEFFIKEFYGHFKFVRDEKGEVSHLIFRDPEHEAPAQKIK
jgi:GNAT superfamily N-acetyltransferase